jgi:hypothetical protein
MSTDLYLFDDNTSKGRDVGIDGWPGGLMVGGATSWWGSLTEASMLEGRCHTRVSGPKPEREIITMVWDKVSHI